MPPEKRGTWQPSTGVCLDISIGSGARKINALRVVSTANAQASLGAKTRLAPEAADVVTGESSSDVIERLLSEALASGPHLILSDYRLKHEDGIAAITAVRSAANISIPAILFSWRSDELFKRQIVKAYLNGDGGYRFLSKLARFTNLQQLRRAIAQYYYNHDRIKLKLNGPAVREATAFLFRRLRCLSQAADLPCRECHEKCIKEDLLAIRRCMNGETPPVAIRRGYRARAPHHYRPALL
jgi:CheY-like chemotaxis protein